MPELSPQLLEVDWVKTVFSVAEVSAEIHLEVLERSFAQPFEILLSRAEVFEYPLAAVDGLADQSLAILPDGSLPRFTGAEHAADRGRDLETVVGARAQRRRRQLPDVKPFLWRLSHFGLVVNFDIDP